jgi:metal-responsive CopG/Arc/MetJ family transcriptional regulator
MPNVLYFAYRRWSMRITVNIPDMLEKEIKKTSENENKTISSIIEEAAEFYLREKQKKKIGRKVLDMVGKIKISADTLEYLHSERKKNDRA